MSGPLSLIQSLAVAKFLAEHVKGVRDGELVPQAGQELVSGEHLAVKFAGRVAAWVTMPRPATRATVKDKAKFTAWVKENLPGEVVTVEEVREATQRQLLEQAKAGGWIGPGGERVPIPGVEVSLGDLVPSVHLEDCAGEVIGAAWRGGEIDLTPLLALPAGEVPGA